jgi:translation elongation factor EF-Tu-like GTPase
VPEIRAQIELFPHSVGTTADGLLLGGYRAVLGLGQTSFSARFEAPIGKGHQPGDTVRVGVQFLVPTAAIPKFPVGTRFTVWEEGRDIGVGEVIECLAHA